MILQLLCGGSVPLSQPQSPWMWLHLSCPVLFGLLLPVHTCVFLSCPVTSCLVLPCPVLSCPFCPFMAPGKGDLFPLMNTIPHTSLQAKANRMVCAPRCQPIPRRMQTPSTNRLRHWLPTPERVVCFCAQTHIHTHRGRPCVVTEGDKWSGRLFPVSSLAYGWPDGWD